MLRWVLFMLLALALVGTSSPDAAGGPLDGVYQVFEQSAFVGGQVPFLASVTQDGPDINFFFMFGFFWSQALGQLDAATGVAQGSLFLPNGSPFLDPSGQGESYGSFELIFLRPGVCLSNFGFPVCFTGSIEVNGVTSEFLGFRFFGSN